MGYGNRSSGSSYGNQKGYGHAFHSKKKQKLADDIAKEKNRLTEMIANGDVGDTPYHHGHVEGQIRALEWVENKIPSDSAGESKHPAKDPVKVQCPRDDTVFEPVVSNSVYGGLEGSGKSIWCPKCGATFNNKPGTNQWANGPQALKIIE